MIVHLIVVFFGKHAYTRLQISPGARQKGRFVTLACKKLSFCLAYEVKPRNRPHISSLSTECGTGALEARRVRMWGRRVKSGTVSSAMHRKIYELSVAAWLNTLRTPGEG